MDTGAFSDLQEFVAALERDGDLARVTRAASTRIWRSPAIVQRVRARGRPGAAVREPDARPDALAHQRVRHDRAGWRARSASTYLDEIGDRIADLLKPELPRGVGGLKDALGKVAQLRPLPPRQVKGAPCQEVVLRGDDVDLDLLPGIKAWPEDGGVFLNLGLTHTKHPETGARNLGMYRLQQQDDRDGQPALADPQGLDLARRGRRAAR